MIVCLGVCVSSTRQIFICMTVSQRSLNSNSPVTLITLKLVWRSVSLFFQSNHLKKMNRRTEERTEPFPAALPRDAAQAPYG